MYRIRENLAELDSQLARRTMSAAGDRGRLVCRAARPVTGSDEELAIELLKDTGVLVQPGHFYDFPSDGYLVLSLITKSEVFKRGIQRMLQFIATRVSA